MIAGFKKFIMGGDIIELAVGLAIASAFIALIKAFNDSFIVPLVNAVMGGGTDGGSFTLNDQVFTYGAFIGAIVTFLITAAVIYFALVVPYQALKARRKGDVVEDPTNEEKMLALLERIAAK